MELDVDAVHGPYSETPGVCEFCGSIKHLAITPDGCHDAQEAGL